MIQDMQQLAESRGGKCLSDEYVNSRTKLKWQCSKNHIWESFWKNVKYGNHWCPICNKAGAKFKYTIKDLKEYAKSKNGECLSNEYIGLKTKMKWRCEKDHVWYTTWNCIKYSESWCRHCENEKGLKRLKQKLTIEEMQQIAKECGGKCLSDKYVYSTSKLLWECSNHHTWYAKPQGIKQGSWCPECKVGISERICRKYFETIFDRLFSKSKPQWLINGKGHRMELDGYCNELGLAFEYQGVQHYIDNPYFSTILVDRQNSDKLKLELCKENNVYLVIVPYFIETDKMEQYIISQCEDFDKYIVNRNISYEKLDIYNDFRAKEIDALAKSFGGVCLSRFYLGYKTKLKWKCVNDHEFEATLATVKNGHWCSHCAGNKKHTIEEMRIIAKEHNGKCLSDVYINGRTPLKWECSKGHRWMAVPSFIINRGSWCPHCRRLPLNEIKELARKHGGECLVKEYKRNDIKLTWQCKHGHIFEKTVNHVKYGNQWCPQCKGRIFLTLDDMHELARKHDGKCLSKEYKNVDEKLDWQCKNGHIFKTNVNSIKYGNHWCPYCAHQAKLTIKEMWELAMKHGGKCLSEKYINAHTKLLWECKEGHMFEKTPNNVKYNSGWCPHCHKK